MTAITSAFDAFLVRLAALYTSANGWHRITNPYSLPDNNELFLAQGYGLALGPGQNTNRTVSCLLSMRREFRVVLSRQVVATEFGIDEKDTTTKSLVEDARALIGDVEKNFTLYEGSNNIQFISDSGIQFIGSGKFSFIFIELIFQVEVFENL